MFRVPVRSGIGCQHFWKRMNSSSAFIRSTFIDYFIGVHGHKHVKSSSVIPLHDPTVPFVNAGMNQFKSVFLGTVDPPCPRAVNSQKCVRVGGKHNDLDVVGTDGHHHTFFEMLGNWSFNDYYKKEACQMAWDLLLGPYRLKPENLVVTYFSGDAIIGLPEDRECRDIWKSIGVPPSRLKGLGSTDNFWEMGGTGPCGPCTEIHYVNSDGSLTEIWNLVFIQCNREADGTVRPLDRLHVDTGMGLERLSALLQKAPSNYHCDLFMPLIGTIEKNSGGVREYNGRYGVAAGSDVAFRRLADHARMVSVCLADQVFPATSLNLKQIMRKCFKISTDVFHNPKLLQLLYTEVANTLGPTYPELFTKASAANIIIEHEEQAYARLRADLSKKWKGLVNVFPEVEAMRDVELPGFALGYKEFKEVMSKIKSNQIPGKLVFKLYDTHGFQEDVIQRIANINNLTIDNKGFWKLLEQHKSRHKTSFKEQNENKGLLFNETVAKLIKSGIPSTNDQYKYDYTASHDKVEFKPLKTKLIAILNEDCQWIDVLEPCENKPYYLVTKDTNFYCEEGGQIADTGVIRINENVVLNVDSVFKIRDFVFHKGCFKLNKCEYVRCDSDVLLEINVERRLNITRNHTAVHLLNAALRKALPNSVVCATGSGVTDQGLYLSLAIYGEKLSQKVLLEAQDMIRQSIKAKAPVESRIVDSAQLASEAAVLTVPGETYPEVGLRLVSVGPPLLSRELCCGTHASDAGLLRDVCVTRARAAASAAPTLYARAGPAAEQVCELFCRAEKLDEVADLLDPERKKQEVGEIRAALETLCAGPGAPAALLARCLHQLIAVMKRSSSPNAMALHAVAESELREMAASAARAGRHFAVHFLRCSYLAQGGGAAGALLRAARPPLPALVLGCAGGTVLAVATVPQEQVTSSFSAAAWLRSAAAVFDARVLPAPAHNTCAEMSHVQVSLINCEQLVQEAMRAAILYAQTHAPRPLRSSHTEPSD